MLRIASLVLALYLLCGQCHTDQHIQTIPIAGTNISYTGTVSLSELDSTKYYTAKFLGIPFALPPIRFSKPVLNIPKEVVFNATKFGNVCPQNGSGNDVCDEGMSEDCLYLNIYVPLKAVSSSPAPTSYPDPYLPSLNTKYAVLIFIHGGAFAFGNGSCHDGSVLAGHGNIIVVTINYRLGILGFLSTNDDVIPGNLGLWDQYTAIQWVNKYIHFFGGDPGRITVGGQSAGSYSSIYHGLYQGNDQLFQRIIAQSGTPAAAKSASKNGYNATLEVARRANCKITGTKEEIKSCLMSKSAADLVSIQLPMLVPGAISIQPTVDSPLVTEDPYVVMSQMYTPLTSNKPTVPPHFISKDLLIGINANDGDVVFGLYAMMLALGNRTTLNQLLGSPIYPDHFKEVILTSFQESYKDIVDDWLTEAVFERYTDWENPNDYSYQSYRAVDMFTDTVFAVPSLDTASAHIRSGNGQNSQGRTFVYRFTLPKPAGGSYLNWFTGTCHSSEMKYVFESNQLREKVDINLAKTVMTYWSNFVKSGDPNKDNSSAVSTDGQSSPLPSWKEYNLTDEQFMELSATPVSKSRMQANSRHFWTKFLPELKYRLQTACKICNGDKVNGQTIYKANLIHLLAQVGMAVAFICML